MELDLKVVPLLRLVQKKNTLKQTIVKKQKITKKINAKKQVPATRLGQALQQTKQETKQAKNKKIKKPAILSSDNLTKKAPKNVIPEIDKEPEIDKLEKPAEPAKTDETVLTKELAPTEELTLETTPSEHILSNAGTADGNLENTETVQYVTHREYEALGSQQALQTAIEQVWTPPVGMQEDILCEVKLTISWDGNVLQRVITKKSDIIVYDLAVEQALDSLICPQAVWGKEIVIAFKP